MSSRINAINCSDWQLMKEAIEAESSLVLVEDITRLKRMRKRRPASGITYNQEHYIEVATAELAKRRQGDKEISA